AAPPPPPPPPPGFPPPPPPGPGGGGAPPPRRAPPPPPRVLDAALAYRVNHSADDRRVDLEGDAGDGHPGLLGAVWGEKPTVVFAFGGFGAQWLGPSTVADPILRAHLRETYATVRAHMSEHERALLDGDGDIPPALQPYATFATQVAVAETLRDYGIVPDAVAGHSFGDLAAAVVAGALTAREGARLLAARTEAVREYARDTAMIVITGENVRDDARWLPDVADVAVVNSAHCVVVACASDRVDEVGTAAACHGYDARPLEVVFGSHSRFVERAVRAFEPATAIGDRTTPIPFYSSTVGAGARAGAVIEAGHWPANLGRRVELPPVAGRLAEDGHGVVIDIGPRPVLAAHLRGQFPGLVVAIDAAADAGFLRTTLGALFTAQVPFRPKRLPPWSSELAAALTWSRAARPIPSLRPAAHQGTGARDADRFVYRFTGEQVRLLTGHRVRGEAVAPGTLTLGCLADALGRTGDTVRLHDVRFLEPVALDEDTTELTLTITREQDDVRVSFSTGRDGEPALCATAVVEAVGDPVPVTLPLPLDLTPIPVDEFYAAFAAAGNAWTGPFRSIVELWASDTHAHVESELTTSCGLGRGIDPALLDAALHGVAAVRYRMAAGLSPRASFFFEGVDTLTFHRPLPSGRARTVIAPNATGDGYDVAVLDAEGRLAVHCAGLRIRPLAAAPDIAPLHRTWVPLALSARRVDRHIVRLRGTRLGEALDVAAVDPPRAEAACEAVVAAVGPGAELIVDLRGGVGTPGSSATDRLAALGMVLAHLARAAGEAGVPLALVTDDIEPADAADDGTVAVDPAALSENALSETTLSEATLSETRGDEFRSAAASFAFSLAGALPYEFPALQVVGIAVAGTGPLGALPSVLELAGRGEHRLRRDTGGLFRAARLSATRAPAAPRARRGAAWSALVRARADRRAELAVVWRDPEFGPRGIGSKRLPEGYDAVRALPDLLRAEADTTEPTRADPVTWPRALSPHATARLDEDAAIHPPHRRATAPTDAGRRVAVVVGGAGGLGRQLARDLLGRSFSRVVLVGTRTHPQTDDLGEHPEIHYLRCDIADPASVETIANRLAELRATETHLFQLAGRLSAGPLTELTHADWVRVLGPKVDGTRHLLELARRCDARMLVAYSSASAVLPSPQFAHYGAANAAMEGVLAAAADVRSAGVRWGFWSGPGMLRDLDSDREFAPDGVEQIDVQDGLGFLWHVLGEYGHDMPVCYPADWASVTARYPSLARDALLRELHEPAPGPSPHDAAPAATASTAERTSEVESLIMETLRITDVSLVRRAPKLRSLGLDSLLAVELRAKIKATFGRAVPIRTLLGPIDAGQLEAVVSGRASE
ncbi:SDR family NAD(P)-dependent oxidoreductase, partial [Nocardia farcinica]|uniref:SDR family NAD(P)-dependent oxidoreductase n=1 Tax=Nocardia farcinica TaxID=37329 RepID=UPI002456D552